MNQPNKNVEEILFSHFDQIKHYLFGFVKDEETAKDLAQDVFLKALAKVKPEASKPEIKSFLYTIARNHAINYLNKTKRTSDIENENLVLESTEEADDLKSQIQKVLESLPPNYRKVLELKDFENYSYKKIAEIFGISESALTSLLNRARREFKKQFLFSIAPRWAVTVSEESKNQDLLEKLHPFAPQEDFWNYLNKKIIEYFSSVYEKWDDIKDEFLKKEVISGLLGQLNLNGQEKVLDVGCGVGKFLTEITKQEISFGIDLNNDLLFEAKKRSNQKSLFICGEMERLPFDSGKFNLLFCNLALHHAKNPLETLNEFQRVLEPNGRLVILDFVKHKKPDLWDKMRNIWLGFAPDDLVKHLKKMKMTNFKTFISEEVNNYPKIFWIICSKKS
ncbi:MAG: methyltransferase domain-containing protein [Calditrichaeota bacterium]|nr:MAG: methyltransferase domain-containing protein [Calditrichota bacterium]